jgi:hypothetical protein
MFQYTTAQLKKALKVQNKIETFQAKIDALTNEIAGILVGGEIPVPFKKGKNKMSVAGRARIAAAQKLRWAKANGKPVKKGKRKMSAAAKAKIAKAAKARWAKVKAAGKNTL